MKLTLNVWRQESPKTPGRLVRYEAPDISPDMSFLEMLDVVNERLMEKGERPIAFDHDCREGICGSCGMMVNGVAHGPRKATTVCQLHMRTFKDGDEITIGRHSIFFLDTATVGSATPQQAALAD